MDGTAGNTLAATPSARALAWRGLPFSLGVVAGMVDVTTFLTLGGLFSAHITGNLASVSADLANDRSLAWATTLAIPMFIVVTAMATALYDRLVRDPSRSVVWFLEVQCGLIIVAGALANTLHVSGKPHDLGGIAVALAAVAAMAAQNALLHLVIARPPATAVMTGNVVVATMAATRLLMQGSRAGPDVRQAWASHWPLIVGFLLGCLFAALAYRWQQDAGWVLSAAASLAALVAWIVRSTGSAGRR
jgi:uncharacterized membrane protein YoaK (UPF0700 family)